MLSFREIFGAPLDQYPLHRITKMVFYRRQKTEQDAHNMQVSAFRLREQMSWRVFAAMAVGTMIATGIFSRMPQQYVAVGPAVLLSFLLSTVVAALTALIYSEFAVLYPVVGGAFVYTLNTFGELAAVLCGTAIVMACLFTVGAVARNFAVYFAQLLGCSVDTFHVHVASIQKTPVDWLAVIIIILLIIILCSPAKFFHVGNIVLQVIHIVMILVIIIVAFSNARGSNWTPFFPPPAVSSHVSLNADHRTARNVVIGASFIFFTFLGYEVVALGAEEAKDKRYSVPCGMLSAVAITATLYLLMTTALVSLIDSAALASQIAHNTKKYNGFALAFAYRGMDGMRNLVAATACIGIFSSTGINMWAMSRILMALAREGILPAIIGKVHHKTCVPVLAVIVAGITGAAIACFTEFNTLANMSSISFLVAFWFVAVAHIFTRYSPQGNDAREELLESRHMEIPSWFRQDRLQGRVDDKGKRALVLGFIAMLTLSSIGFSWYWNVVPESSGWLLACVLSWFVFTVLLQVFMPIVYVPQNFAVPFWAMPWVPSMAIFSTIFLMGIEGSSSDFVRVGVAMCIGISTYCLFGVYTTYYRFKVAPTQDIEERGLALVALNPESLRNSQD